MVTTLDDVTLLGTAGQVVTGILGVDLPGNPEYQKNYEQKAVAYNAAAEEIGAKELLNLVEVVENLERFRLRYLLQKVLDEIQLREAN